MRFTVLGAGAIGSVFGGLLFKDGHDVVLVGRSDHMQAIREGGLTIDGIWGRHTIRGITCCEDIDQLAEPFRTETDAALLCVKSYDTPEIMHSIHDVFHSVPPVVSLQNGLGNVEKISETVGEERTIGGRVIFGVIYNNPGSVTVTVSADNTKIGYCGKRKFDRNISNIAGACTGAGIATDGVDDIERWIFEKTLYNCALNGLATLLNVHYGALLDSDECKRIMQSVIAEMFAIARSDGIELSWEDPNDYAGHLFEHLIPVTFDHHPSMLQDISRGKRTEIDALNGAVAVRGKQYGIDTPANDMITGLIKARETICR